MKGIVVYYSATGNTQKIANTVHLGMKRVLDQCDIGEIKNLNPEDMAAYDVIAIGGPLWYWRESSNLRLFAYNMPKMDGKLCALFCCHGSSPFGFFYSLARILMRKGLTFIGWKDWYASVYQVLHLPYPYLTHGHPDEIAFKEAERFGYDMAQRALRIAAGETDLIPEVPKGPNADPLWKPFVADTDAFVPGSERRRQDSTTPAQPETNRPRRKINQARCTYPECTTCMDLCPKNAFDTSVSPPEVRKTCIECSICECVCPNDAIEIGKAGTVYLPTIKRIDMTRCKYPQCTVCIDNCNNNSIDFSQNPPVFKNNCERDDLCWLICPEGAIEILNLEETHGTLKMEREAQGKSAHYPSGLLQQTIDAEKMGKFRRVIPINQVGWDNLIMYMTHHPRFNIKDLKDD